MPEEDPIDRHAAFGTMHRYINFKIGAKQPNRDSFPLYVHMHTLI